MDLSEESCPGLQETRGYFLHNSDVRANKRPRLDPLPASLHVRFSDCSDQTL